MKALISGRAGIAFLNLGDARQVMRIETDNLEQYDQEQSLALANDLDDLTEIEVSNLEQVRRRLRLAWRTDRAILLMLALLDSRSSHQTRMMATRVIEVLVGAPELLTRLQNLFYSAPLPVHSTIRDAQRTAAMTHASGVQSLLAGLVTHQDPIRFCRAAWDALPLELFGSRQLKEKCRLIAISAGLFRYIARCANVTDAQRVEITDLATGFHIQESVVDRWLSFLALIRSNATSIQFQASRYNKTIYRKKQEQAPDDFRRKGLKMASIEFVKPKARNLYHTILSGVGRAGILTASHMPGADHMTAHRELFRQEKPSWRLAHPVIMTYELKGPHYSLAANKPRATPANLGWEQLVFFDITRDDLFSVDSEQPDFARFDTQRGLEAATAFRVGSSKLSEPPASWPDLNQGLGSIRKPKGTRNPDFEYFRESKLESRI